MTEVPVGFILVRRDGTELFETGRVGKKVCVRGSRENEVWTRGEEGLTWVERERKRVRLERRTNHLRRLRGNRVERTSV